MKPIKVLVVGPDYVAHAPRVKVWKLSEMLESIEANHLSDSGMGRMIMGLAKRLRKEVKAHKQTKEMLRGEVDGSLIDRNMCNAVDNALGDYRQSSESLDEAVVRMKQELKDTRQRLSEASWTISNMRQ